MENNELYHYGVKGMKWGVRRDARILANHRHNVAVTRLENEYMSGKIGSKQYRQGLANAKAAKKQTLSSMKDAYKNAKSDEERASIGKSITEMTTKEIPNSKIKRGAAVANQLLGTANIASVAGTAVNAALINPAFAGAYIGASTVAIAAETGWRYVTRRYLDGKS